MTDRCADCSAQLSHCHGTLILDGLPALCTDPDCVDPDPARHALALDPAELEPALALGAA